MQFEIISFGLIDPCRMLYLHAFRCSKQEHSLFIEERNIIASYAFDLLAGCHDYIEPVADAHLSS